MGLVQGLLGFYTDEKGERWTVCRDLSNDKYNCFAVSTQMETTIERWASGEIPAHQTGLDPDSMEMCLSGINPDDWDRMFSEPEEDNDE